MFAATTQKLDNLILNLENELGVPSVSINPDDPWALYRLKNESISSNIQLKRCNCGYRMTTPFELRCPCCGFKSQQPDAFYLPTTEEMLAALPKRSEPQAKQQKVQSSESKSTPASNQKAPAPEAKQQPPATSSNSNSGSLETSWSKVGIQVAQVISVANHPDADGLYVLEVNIGSETRPVCAGLRNFYKPDQLNQRIVCAITNLKPSKLKGKLSAAMLLAGSAGDQVRLVEPPQGSKPGDAIFLEGSKPNEGIPKTLNSKFWKEVVANFKVKDGKATVGEKSLVTENGFCLVPDLPDGSEIH